MGIWVTVLKIRRVGQLIMYQIRDKKEQKIVARFLEKDDAEAFLRKQGMSRKRYIIVKVGGVRK